MKTHRRSFLQNCALASTGLLLTSRGAAETSPVSPGSGDVFAVIQGRRSVRQFKPDPVPEADICRILGAARLAPTSGNQQPWKFLVVRDPAKITAMKEACIARRLGRSAPAKPLSEEDQKNETKVRNGLAGYFSAPVYIVVLTDNRSTYPDYNHWDGPLAAGTMMLAARALGYGTVFITDVIPDEVTKQVFQISDRYTRVCITPLGVPVSWPESPPKKALEEFIAWEVL